MVTSDRYLNASSAGSGATKTKKKKRDKKSRKHTSGSEEDVASAAVAPEIERPVVYAEPGEMPEGVDLSDDDKGDTRPDTDPHKALDIDLEPM
jgi:hypothetical protein